jgi:hypothetical protein
VSSSRRLWLGVTLPFYPLGWFYGHAGLSKLLKKRSTGRQNVLNSTIVRQMMKGTRALRLRG